MQKPFHQQAIEGLEKLKKNNSQGFARVYGNLFTRVSRKKDEEGKCFLVLHTKHNETGIFKIDLERLSEAIQTQGYSLAATENALVILFSKPKSRLESVGHIDIERREIHVAEKHAKRLLKLLFPRV